MSHSQVKLVQSSLQLNRHLLHEALGVGETYDLQRRTLQLERDTLDFYYCTGLCDSRLVVELMKVFVYERDRPLHLDNDLVHQQVQRTTEWSVVHKAILSGLIVIIADGQCTAYIVDVRNYPGRQPEEPDTEKVVRGARDGFVENIVLNSALIRRRVRDGRLRFEMIEVGQSSRSDVCLVYIKELASEKLLTTIRERLATIEVVGVPMAEKTLEEFLVNPYHPYPRVRYTERPDVAAIHLLEGHALLFCDTSPSAMIAPASFFHHMQHAEEYRQTPLVGTVIRIIRYIGVFLSVFLLPLWLWAYDLFGKVSIIGPKKSAEIPLFLQIMVADFGVESLRLAAIHTPTALSTALGLIAAVIIGQVAIDVGWFVPEVVLYVAIAAVGSFATPSYELALANKLAKWYLLIAVTLFGTVGLVVATLTLFIYLSRLTSFGLPYLAPFYPLHRSLLWRTLLRYPVPDEQKENVSALFK